MVCPPVCIVWSVSVGDVSESPFPYSEEYHSFSFSVHTLISVIPVLSVSLFPCSCSLCQSVSMSLFLKWACFPVPFVSVSLFLYYFDQRQYCSWPLSKPLSVPWSAFGPCLFFSERLLCHDQYPFPLSEPVFHTWTILSMTVDVQISWCSTFRILCHAGHLFFLCVCVCVYVCYEGTSWEHACIVLAWKRPVHLHVHPSMVLEMDVCSMLCLQLLV